MSPGRPLSVGTGQTLEPVRFLVGFLGLLAGAVIGLMGAFIILYSGEEGSEGNTYVNLGGSRIDADIVGVPVLVVGLIGMTLALLLLRRSKGALTV